MSSKSNFSWAAKGNEASASSILLPCNSHQKRYFLPFIGSHHRTTTCDNGTQLFFKPPLHNGCCVGVIKDESPIIISWLQYTFMRMLTTRNKSVSFQESSCGHTFETIFIINAANQVYIAWHHCDIVVGLLYKTQHFFCFSWLLTCNIFVPFFCFFAPRLRRVCIVISSYY